MRALLTLAMFGLLLGCSASIERPSAELLCKESGLTPGSQKYTACLADLDAKTRERRERCSARAEREVLGVDTEQHVRIVFERAREAYERCMAETSR